MIIDLIGTEFKSATSTQCNGLFWDNDHNSELYFSHIINSENTDLPFSVCAVTREKLGDSTIVFKLDKQG